MSDRRASRAQIWGLLGLMIAIALLWNTWPLYPLRIMVVFFHELSHGAAAILTGGSVEGIEVVAGEGGMCMTRGGSPIVIWQAGYLGSVLWGGALLVLAARTRTDKLVTGCLGAVIAAATLLYVRPYASFGFGFGVAAGLVQILLARHLPHDFHDWFLKIVGLTSCLYAVLDIKDDVLDRPGTPSDAYMLAQYTGVPAWIWGGAWIAAAVAVALFCLIWAGRAKAE